MHFNNMTREEKAHQIATACREIMIKLNGGRELLMASRVNPNQDAIIEKGAKQYNVCEKHIRTLLNTDAGRRPTRYVKE